MVAFFALLCVCCAAVLTGGYLIRFFWAMPLKKGFACAGFFVAIFCLFWASGLWVSASRHSWGALTPVFALFLLAGWLAVKYGPRLFRWAIGKIRNDDHEG